MRTVDKDEVGGLGEKVPKKVRAIEPREKWQDIPGKPDHERNQSGDIRLKSERARPLHVPFYVAPSLDWWMSQRKD